MGQIFQNKTAFSFTKFLEILLKSVLDCMTLSRHTQTQFPTTIYWHTEQFSLEVHLQYKLVLVLFPCNFHNKQIKLPNSLRNIKYRMAVTDQQSHSIAGVCMIIQTVMNKM